MRVYPRLPSQEERGEAGYRIWYYKQVKKIKLVDIPIKFSIRNLVLIDIDPLKGEVKVDEKDFTNNPLAAASAGVELGMVSMGLHSETDRVDGAVKVIKNPIERSGDDIGSGALGDALSPIISRVASLESGLKNVYTKVNALEEKVG